MARPVAVSITLSDADRAVLVAASTLGAWPRSARALEQSIESHVAATNADPTPFACTTTADEILESVARYCQRTTNSHHGD